MECILITIFYFNIGIYFFGGLYMKKNIEYVFGIITLLLILELSACSGDLENNEFNIVLKNYMEAYKDGGTSESVVYTYFMDESKKKIYADTNDHLIDYKVEESEKINDDLYAYTILVQTEQLKELKLIKEGEYLRIYNFVARIDGRLYYINGINNIPDNIKNDLDEEKYSYSNNETVFSSDT